MKVTFRWFGKDNDTVSLDEIKQIPGVEGIVWALHDVPAGEIWPKDRILDVKKQADEYNFNIDVVESVNIHESIKLGSPEREEYIEKYKQTLNNLGEIGVKVVCYNFMPVFDWVRTDLYKELEDGSNALFYENEKIEGINPIELVESMEKSSENLTLPGWEPERLKELDTLFNNYENVTEKDLFENLSYFLKEIVPVAEENDIKMAIHPDDPPWPVFGLPRIVKNKKDIKNILNIIDSPSNGITLCTGSLGANPNNDIPDIIESYSDYIPFVHIRNLKKINGEDFIETSHRESDGDIPVLKVMKALYDSGFDGYLRPDHGRHIWGEEPRPGYGLYDRGLGIMYLLGIWDTIMRWSEKNEKK